jgi:ferrochelatase
LRKILFVANLGSPEDCTPKAVDPYLREFLMDPRVVDIPYALRWLLVHTIIVPFRKHRSAKAYAKVWLEEGSPLRVVTQRFAEKLAVAVKGKYEVVWGMRYSTPAIANVLADLRLTKDDTLYFVPLYPHYATSSSESSVDALRAALAKKRSAARIFYLQDFYDHPRFIAPLTAQVRVERKDADFILFSYHGLPERHLKKLPNGEFCLRPGCCDLVRHENRLCYRAQAFRTTRLVATALGLKSDEYETSFQSRLGRTPWIQPFTDVKLEELARRGVRKLAVVCPSFVTDCLETLEEIQIAGRETFRAAGGDDLHLIPCLNDSDAWVEQFSQMVGEVTWQELHH